MAAKLYKYAAIGEYTESNIMMNRLYFSTPASFNDPFECQISTRLSEEFGLSKMEKLKNLTRAYLQQEMTGNFDAMFSYIRESNPELINDLEYIIYKAFEYTLLRESYSESESLLKRELFRDTGILCLTSERDNILMWSHYANNHEGMCLELDAEKLRSLGKIQDVNYVPAFQEVDSIEDSMVMKLDCWSYEKEKRIIKHKWVTDAEPTNPGLHKMLPGTITGIIFGCKTPYDTVHKYTGIARKYHPNIRIYAAERVKSNFKLEITEYDVSSYPS